MHRLVFALLASILLCAGGFAQPGPSVFSGGEPPRPDSPDSPVGASVRPPDLPAGPFPLLPVLETALAGEVLWRPDWPVEIPPDIFAVSGQARSVTVALEFPGAGGREGSAGADTAAPPDAADSSDRAGPPDAAGRAEYALAYDEAGRLTDFPFFENGGFFQTRADYDDLGRISGLAVSAPGSRQFEFLEYDRETGRPSLLRINAGSAAENAGGADSGGSWFFVVLEYRGLSASETWYDSAGAGLAFYSYRYALQAGKKRLAESAGFSGGESRAAEYYYDSWGNLTGIGGAYSAVYRGSRPQYWRRPLDPAFPGGGAAGEPWRFIFQWDERGLITRVLGYPEAENAGGEWDARYDYTPDSGGNWRERREIRMVRQGDYLFPQPGVLITRQIGYQGQ